MRPRLQQFFFGLRLSCVLALALLPPGAFAQDPFYYTIHKGSGLPSNSVYDIFQDQKGYIWMAHEEGISRYDGHTFKTFYSDEQTSRAGSVIKEDKFGRIWYENFDGHLYYVQNDSLHALKSGKPIGFFHYGLVEDKLFCLSTTGVMVYDLVTLRLRATLPFDLTELIFATQSSDSYYLYATSIYEISADMKVKKTEAPFSSGPQTPGLMAACGANIYMVNRSGSQTVYTIQENQCRPLFPVQSTYVNNFTCTGNDLWLLCARGTYCYTTGGKALNNGAPYFRDKNFSNVMKDREGNYWFATLNEGVLLVPDLNTWKFSGNQISPTRISVMRDNLYMGTSFGEVLKMNLGNYKTEVLTKANDDHDIYMLETDSSAGRLFYTSSIFEVTDEQGKTLQRGILATKDCRKIDETYYAYAATGNCGILRVSDKGAAASRWTATYLKYVAAPANKNSFPVAGIITGVRGKSLAFNPANGKIYYATSAGCYIVSPDTFTELQFEGHSFYLSRLQNYGDALFALSTHGKLYTISAGNVVQSYALAAPYNDFLFRNIRIIGQHLFLFTDKQLLYIDLAKQTASPTRLSIGAEGLNDVAVWRNKLLLATNEGVLVKDFALARQVVGVPLFYVNNFMVNEKVYDLQKLPDFAHDENDVEIFYSILSFSTNGQYPLYYRINNENWRLTSPETRSLKLASLAPGYYTISFRLGDSNRWVRQVMFNVSKPYWEELWFLILCLLLISLAGVSIYRWQTGNLRKRNALLVEKIELEKNLRNSMLTSIKSQMNPHFFYNALNTIQSFIYSDDKRNASFYLAKFSKLTRMILEMSEQERITLAEEVKALTLYLELEQARFAGDFNFEIRVEDHLDTDWVNIPSMIVQPYVENAIKHGLLHKTGSKYLLVNFERVGHDLCITIDDNGIGRKKSMELNDIKHSRHRSFAMQANEKRIELLNRGHNSIGLTYTDKTDAAGFACGTTVQITLPVFKTTE